jgi:hypothetical protein
MEFTIIVSKSASNTNTSQQRQLAHSVAAMDVYRRYLLGKGNLFGVRPSLQPVGYVAAMPYVHIPSLRTEYGKPINIGLSRRVRDCGRGTRGCHPVGSALHVAEKVLCWL